jgi:hypothetical protein
MRFAANGAPIDVSDAPFTGNDWLLMIECAPEAANGLRDRREGAPAQRAHASFIVNDPSLTRSDASLATNDARAP